MDPITIAHLAAKYSVSPEMIVRLKNLSLTITDESTGQTVKDMAQRAYNKIIADLGVDPLV